ncbi:AAA family ATPase [Glycomyces sp. L485]|uniref:AAA family ATPase n=1 Tax=Glycomyces sp. L485 TaxID=2909235 RepID=UPI001F4B4223|nr:AAA family ATPase [Glycomyces sp. L485]MCH7231495.1 AAA family ATPase [Glycomyces sp. L485]
MIVWLNGTYGAGKSTLADLLAQALPARLFDSEHIGYLLRPIIGDIPCEDFKDWDPWRGLTIEPARQVLDFTGGTLVIPQTVLQHRYWTELVDGFTEANIPMRAFTLHAEREVWAERVEADTVETGAKAWRLDHREVYERALSDWMARETTVVDTTGLAPDEAVKHLLAQLGA